MLDIIVDLTEQYHKAEAASVYRFDRFIGILAEVENGITKPDISTGNTSPKKTATPKTKKKK
jgi:hypothetical protein